MLIIQSCAVINNKNNKQKTEKKIRGFRNNEAVVLHVDLPARKFCSSELHRDVCMDNGSSQLKSQLITSFLRPIHSLALCFAAILLITSSAAKRGTV